MKGEAFIKAIQEIARTSPPPLSKLPRKDVFLRYIATHAKIRAKERAVSAAGLDLGEFADDYYGMATCLLYLAFVPHQVDTIEWWLYENVEKVIYWPEEGREWRLDTPEQLWDYLQTTGPGGEK